MPSYLVDTGVFVRWFVAQDGWEHAREIRDNYLAGTVALETVDFVRIETANVLRKIGLLSGVLDVEALVVAARMIDDMGMVAHPTDADMLERSVRFATARNLAVYDAVIAARALERGAVLLTSDQRLCRAIAGFVKTELLRGVGAAAAPPPAVAPKAVS